MINCSEKEDKVQEIYTISIVYLKREIEGRRKKENNTNAYKTILREKKKKRLLERKEEEKLTWQYIGISVFLPIVWF